MNHENIDTFEVDGETFLEMRPEVLESLVEETLVEYRIVRSLARQLTKAIMEKIL